MCVCASFRVSYTHRRVVQPKLITAGLLIGYPRRRIITARYAGARTAEEVQPNLSVSLFQYPFTFKIVCTRVRGGGGEGGGKKAK